MHLAVVFDPQSKEVRHYANGSLLAKIALKDSSPFKPGIAELGNGTTAVPPASPSATSAARWTSLRFGTAWLARRRSGGWGGEVPESSWLVISSRFREASRLVSEIICWPP